MKSKFIFVFFSVFLILISSVFISSASTFVPYSSLTDTSSQASLLFNYYRNLDTFSYDDDFLIMRSGQYEYYLFYGDLTSDTVNYISYIGQTSSGYNTIWTIDIGVESNFSYVLNEYSVVGNIPGTAAYSDFYDSYNDFIVQVCIILICIFFIFYIFRPTYKELT